MATAPSTNNVGRVSQVIGAVGVGGWDGYVQAFKESQAHQFAPITATAIGVAQFGTGGIDRVDATAIDGNDLYTAGIEDGRIVLRKFALDAEGRPSLSATRDLGLASGDIAGLAVVDGKVMVSGTTRNDALDVGTITAAHNAIHALGWPCTIRNSAVATISLSATGSRKAPNAEYWL